MANFSDPSWDIQFQSDRNDPKGLVNIGWFWSRSSIKTLEYYKTSRKQWLDRGGWDQAVMNDVLSRIENKRKTTDDDQSILRATRLDRDRYINYMLISLFSALSPRVGDTKNIYTLSEEIRYESILNVSKISVMWHYTCVEKALKSYFAKYYGQWTDIDGYYTDKRLFLSPLNLGFGVNNNQILLSQFLISIQLAMISGRTLIFPDIVYLNGVNLLPGVRAFSIKQLDMENISYVEPTYLFNRQTKHDIHRPTPVTRQLSLVKKMETLVNDLRSNLTKTELVVLDFANFNITNEIFSLNFSSKPMKNFGSIRLCYNIASSANCLRICQ